MDALKRIIEKLNEEIDNEIKYQKDEFDQTEITNSKNRENTLRMCKTFVHDELIESEKMQNIIDI